MESWGDKGRQSMGDAFLRWWWRSYRMNVEERVMGPGTLRNLEEGTSHHGEHGVDLAKPRTSCMAE